MSGIKEKLKDALHLNKKDKEDRNAGEPDFSHSTAFGEHGETVTSGGRESFDSELAAMDPKEREDYLKEFADAEKDDNWTPKKGSLLEKLIARGNKKTEDELAAEHQLRGEKKLAQQEGIIR
ncbi:hypothetical protein K491DRAFT_694146 [Lophiostoma macrostomum CBS 122681]|uniref:Uncharacterized protein n=1 Tax=Lophiostoma macrostomum CBS 122681 TaxID=1314788 RepID=A0A6A6T434_9PLEO|nr:hypothetical protein K491DRAFT_694146 [Lophiostoma macrostomum CBS 122681]